jgi:8-oxo-dGTP pyrophosphatase MutT (NUDIX family)
VSRVDLTVAAVVERDGAFLIVEEPVAGKLCLTQPGGHIEAGESPEQAVRREVLEESGCSVAVRDVIGSYLWTDEDRQRQFLRIVFLADLLTIHRHAELDPAIHAVHWCSYAELAARRNELRSTSVIRCIDDYLAGSRQPRSLYSGYECPQQQLDSVLASAALVPA